METQKKKRKYLKYIIAIGCVIALAVLIYVHGGTFVDFLRNMHGM